MVSKASAQHVSNFGLKNSGAVWEEQTESWGKAKQQAKAVSVCCRVSKPSAFLSLFSTCVTVSSMPTGSGKCCLSCFSRCVCWAGLCWAVGKGRRLMPPQPHGSQEVWGQLVLQDSMLAEPCRPAVLKRQKDRRCAAHDTHLWVSALHLGGREGAG